MKRDGRTAAPNVAQAAVTTGVVMALMFFTGITSS